jgi:predicted transcriptional regulator
MAEQAPHHAEQAPPHHVELTQLLGELELAIMQVVWARGDVAVRQVYEALQSQRSIAYTTVMTVMSRLAQKGILATRKQGKAYYYHATVTANELVAQRAQRAVDNVLATFGDAARAHFLRNIEALPPEQRVALQHIIAQEQRDAH